MAAKRQWSGCKWCHVKSYDSRHCTNELAPRWFARDRPHLSFPLPTAGSLHPDTRTYLYSFDPQRSVEQAKSWPTILLRAEGFSTQHAKHYQALAGLLLVVVSRHAVSSMCSCVNHSYSFRPCKAPGVSVDFRLPVQRCLAAQKTQQDQRPRRSQECRLK